MCVSEHFESIETYFFFSKIFVNFALREKRVIGQRNIFFLETENASAKHKLQGGEATKNASEKHKARGSERPRMQAQSTKPKGAKPANNPAGLAGRFT